MFQQARRLFGVLLLGLLSGLGMAGWQAWAEEPQGSPAKGARTANEVRGLLQKPGVAAEKGFDADTPLAEALRALSERCEVTIRVDYDAFARMGGLDAQSLDSTPVQLRPIKLATLATILKDLLANLNNLVDGGATYLVRGDSIVIVPAVKVLAASDGVGGLELPVGESLREPVCVAVDKRPLRETLRDLADNTGANIVFDSRQQEPGELPVSITVQHVPLETVVRLLADMVELKAIAIDNVLYVTSPENAEKLVREQKERAGIPVLPLMKNDAPRPVAESVTRR
jgi:hypothetical protein